MEKTLMMPASYNVMNEQEMTYTEGGATALEALCAWVVPFYGWFRGTLAIRDHRRAHPNNWIETGMDALNRHMSSNAVNMLYDLACTAWTVGVCSTGVGLIPTALIVLS